MSRETQAIRAEVKWFDAVRGYGFLTSKADGAPEARTTDFFVHFSAIQGKTPQKSWCRDCKAWFGAQRDECPRCRGLLVQKSYRILAELQEVDILEWEETPKGLRALKVRKL